MAHLLISIIAGASAIIFIALINKRIVTARLIRQHGCKPVFRYPHLDPLFGLDLKLLEIIKSLKYQSIPFAASLHNKYGKTFSVQQFGTSALRTIDPENLQAVYSTNHADWGYQPVRLPVMEPFCGRGFITTDGEVWRIARGLLRPTFSKRNISDLSYFAASLDEIFEQVPKDGRTVVDLQGLFAKLYLNTSMKFLLGVSPNASNPDSASAGAFLKAFNSSLIGMGLSFLLGPFQFLIPKSFKSTAYKKVHEYVDSFIEQAINNSRTKESLQYSLLEGLVKQTDDRLEIRHNVLQAMMAAQDTTYVLLSNTLFLLSRHPAVYEKLRAEVRNFDLDVRPGLFDDLRGLKFLRNIICESLRLYPIFPIMVRAALRETTLPRGGGSDGKDPIYVPEGTKIYSNYYALHRDESVFGKDATSFVPERWDSIKPGSFEYMPFGAGPRACVGKEKALSEASYTLAKFAKLYKGVESRDYEEWAGQLKLTARNAHGCRVVCVAV